MKQIVISTYSYQDQIQRYIYQRIKRLKIKAYIPNIEIEKKGQAIFFTCFFPSGMPDSKKKRYFKDYIIMPVAQAIVDIIQKEFAPAYGNEIIQKNYQQQEIIITGLVQEESQIKKLLDPVIYELTENSTFCLDGWIRFRLFNYRIYLKEMVEHLVGEYLAYKEYKEFILLIKEFIFEKKSLLAQIHLIPNKNGHIDLYDEDKEWIEFDQEPYHNQDDIVLNTLLTLAPEKMTIHQEKKYENIQLIDTIKQIYEGRITFCIGCTDCKKIGPKTRLIATLKHILTHKKL